MLIVNILAKGLDLCFPFLKFNFYHCVHVTGGFQCCLEEEV